MPITSVQDARDVERTLDNILHEADNHTRIRHIRYLLEEKLDFEPAGQLVSLASAGNDQLPADAHLVAHRDGVTVAYVPLDNAASNRVTAAVAISATRALAAALNDQLLLFFTNRDGDQLHIISPDLSGSRPRLQRLVAYRDQPQRTVPQQIANLWHSYGVQGKTMGQAIEEAFSVEPVTKEFFQTYRDIFNRAKSDIGGFGGTEEERENQHVFTQTLFNRLMFVYFLSRKGWLKFKDNTDYLNALWSDYGSLEGDNNFYTARLNPLFFAGLNNSQSRNVTSNNDGVIPVIGNVPFLNGGLFEETDLDQRGDITVPDDVIQQILTGLFDRFNFTVMESTPFDVEVAVDPEMLGKVFEELVTGRHDSGAYYTPRPVVSFMCLEALKGYLEGRATGASAEAVAAFVDRHDIQEIGLSEAVQISDALREVRVVDPACGSGAYLLGMMQELIELQRTLFDKGLDARKDYDLKLEIIQRNLYGVDIDYFAVNIAMLRLWLSLAIDYEGDDPQPLPNLDFKVLCGDSLLGPDPSAGVEVQGTLGQDTEQFRRLGELKGEYMRASLGTDKDRLRAEIRENEAAIREALGAGGADKGVIDWRVEFAEVFAERRGFDVVIGNPPYVESRSSAISEALKDSYRGQVQRDWGESLPRGSDLLMYFYPRSVKLLSDNGYGCFITQNTWLNTDYGHKFQQFSIGRFSFLKIIDSSTRFFTNVDSQNINAVISVFTKIQSPTIEYGIADNEMNVTHRGHIPASSPMKWGPLFETPQFMQAILARISSFPEAVKPITFGQGLNFPKRELNQRGSNLDVIVKDTRFVALSADGKIDSKRKSKQRKVPALIMPRGIGSRYYCTFNTCKAFSYSAVELYLPDELWESDAHYCLWAYLNSSFVWLFRELTGRKNLGGGMLKAEATDMNALPVNLDFDFATPAREVHEVLKHREPLPVAEEVYTSEHLFIDEMVANCLGFADQQEEIRQSLIERVSFRHQRARQRG